jgi:hypothetical protein
MVHIHFAEVEKRRLCKAQPRERRAVLLSGLLHAKSLPRMQDSSDKRRPLTILSFKLTRFVIRHTRWPAMFIDTLHYDNEIDMQLQNARAHAPLGDTRRGGIYGR